MSVKVQPQKFVAGDGQKFATKAEAEAHDKLVEAIRDYERAQERLNDAMASTIKTADGELFDVRRWRNYWFVSKFGSFGPALVGVQVGYGTRLQLPDSYHKARVEVVIQRNVRDGLWDFVHYNVAELYADERNANAALLEAIEEDVAEKGEQMAKIKKQMNDGGRS